MEMAPVESFDPDYFAANGYPHDVWAWMRENAPVARYDVPGRQPFWAITRYKDIVSIGRDPQLNFISAPGITILRTDQPAVRSPLQLLLTMDPPQHSKHRGVMRDQFRPRAMQALDDHIVQRCREIADAVASARLSKAQGDVVDFVDAVAMRLPLDVILELLGVPTSDRDQMYAWSNAVVGSEDPDYGDVDTPHEAVLAARQGIFGYFMKFITERRAAPRDDGEPLTDMDILGYCFVLMIAGNETTRNATSGALLTLFEHPQAMAELTADPSLMPTAVEELLRWVAPIIYMARTATKNVEIGGQMIPEGDKVVMFYPSANRDPEVFANPTLFDIRRNPNEHLTFGFGRHRCLGNDLARIELRAVLSEILRRFPNIRPAGQPSRLRSNFVGGIKYLPVDFGDPVAA